MRSAPVAKHLRTTDYEAAKLNVWLRCRFRRQSGRSLRLAECLKMTQLRRSIRVDEFEDSRRRDDAG